MLLQSVRQHCHICSAHADKQLQFNQPTTTPQYGLSSAHSLLTRAFPTRLGLLRANIVPTTPSRWHPALLPRRDVAQHSDAGVGDVFLGLAGQRRGVFAVAVRDDDSAQQLLRALSASADVSAPPPRRMCVPHAWTLAADDDFLASVCLCVPVSVCPAMCFPPCAER